MITDAGKQIILRDLAEQGPNFAEVMAFGVADAPPTVGDTMLGFEIHRAEIDLLDYDAVASTVTVRATIPDFLYFQLHEVGLFVGEDQLDDEVSSEIVTRFDTEAEGDWDGFTVVNTTNTRIGDASLQINIAGSAVGTLTKLEPFGKYDAMQPSDTFALAYNSIAGTPSQIEVRFLNDATNYVSHVFTPGAGFNVARWTKSSMVATGAPDWDDFETMEIVVTAGATAAELLLEGFRTDLVRADSDDTLVARTLFAEPLEKRGVAEVQVEYVLGLSFNA